LVTPSAAAVYIARFVLPPVLPTLRDSVFKLLVNIFGPRSSRPATAI